jgi:hypothetical protein
MRAAGGSFLEKSFMDNNQGTKLLAVKKTK